MASKGKVSKPDGLSPVPITLDKPRTLWYADQLDWLEDELGLNAFSGSLWQDLTAKRLKLILWRGLLHEDKDLTLEQVSAMFPPARFREVMRAAMYAWGIDPDEAAKGSEEESAQPDPPQ